MSTSSATCTPPDIAHHFADIPDPRHPGYRDHHRLSDILVIALSAMISKSESWDDIAQFGRSKEEWLREIGLKLPNGIPSHDTFNRIFSALDPQAFQHAFDNWIGAVCQTLDLVHVPIDGKSLRGSRGPEGTCLHLVSAWVVEHRLTLAQVAVQDKSNEIIAIPQLLAMLQLKGALVSIDAMGCQKAIAQQIREAKADYLLGLKENQPTLHEDVEACFLKAFSTEFEGVKHETYATEEVSHGRREERICTVIYDPEGLRTKEEWADLKSVIQVLRIRRQGDRESEELSYYISSSSASAKKLAEGIRAHWAIENCQHWCLDVLFDEDHCRTQNRNAAENLAWLRKMVLSLLRQEPSKGSIPNKRLRAALDDNYRLEILNLLQG